MKICLCIRVLQKTLNLVKLLFPENGNIFHARVRSLFCSLNLLYFEVLITGLFIATRRTGRKNNLSRLTRSGDESFIRSQSIQSNFGTELRPLQHVVNFASPQSGMEKMAIDNGDQLSISVTPFLPRVAFSKEAHFPSRITRAEFAIPWALIIFNFSFPFHSCFRSLAFTTGKSVLVSRLTQLL